MFVQFTEGVVSSGPFAQPCKWGQRVSKLDVSSSDACKQLTVLDFKMALFLCQRESAISGKEKETESVIDIVQDLFFHFL